MGRLTAALLAAAALAVGATGCGERSEPKGLSVSVYPVTVASEGERPLVFERPARRIAFLSRGPYEIVDTLGAGGRIVGLPLATNGSIELRRLKRLRPDLIVASATADEAQLSRAQAATGARVYLAPGGSIVDVERTITQLGLITDTPVRARRLVREIEARRRFVSRRLAGAPPVSVFVDLGLFTTISDQSLAGDLMRQAGGQNVAGAPLDSGPFDLVELRHLDPQVYLATSDSGTTLAALRHDRRVRKLTAVRTGRFTVIDPGLLEPGPEVGEHLVELARTLHPNAFR